MKLFLPAYAKINLGLRVLGKREDGFHEIETILQQVDLHDDLTVLVQTGRKIDVRSRHPEVPEGAENLCWRAADLMRRRCRVRAGVKISVTKRIPVGAGLGGGSSDAAVTLVALNHLWKTNLPPARLEELAGELGSDVPFFIRGGAAIASGRGERLAPVRLPVDYRVLIVYPRFSVSTAEAYKGVRLPLTNTRKGFSLESLTIEGKHFRRFCRRLQNDLEKVVVANHPSLAELKTRLREEGAFFASMSGSGSAIFGLFEDELRVQDAARSFTGDYPTFITRPITWGLRDVEMKWGEQL